MNYRIVMTAKADEQLADIAFYIADDSGSVNAALEYLEKLEGGIDLLQTSPYLGRVPRNAVLRKQGYRVLIIERYMVFYKVNDKSKPIVICQVISSRREYERLI